MSTWAVFFLAFAISVSGMSISMALREIANTIRNKKQPTKEPPMKTNEQKFTAREWLTRYLPEGGEWRRFENYILAYPIGDHMGGVRLNITGQIDSPCTRATKAHSGKSIPIPRATAIDLMVKAWEQQAGDATEASKEPTPAPAFKVGDRVKDRRNDLVGEIVAVNGDNVKFFGDDGDHKYWGRSVFFELAKSEPVKEAEKDSGLLSENAMQQLQRYGTIDPQLFELVKAMATGVITAPYLPTDDAIVRVARGLLSEMRKAGA